MASGPITSWQIDGEKMETAEDLIFLGSIISADGDCSHELKRHLLLGRKAMTNLTSILKSKLYWHHFVDKGPYSQSYGFSSSHTRMWEMDHKEDWALKNWYFWTLVLEKTPEGPLDIKEIKLFNPKGNQPWRTDAEAETSVLWPPDMKISPLGKDPDSGKDWGQEEKGSTEEEMVGWHHWLKGHEFKQTLGDSEGQGSLVCCSPWHRKESYMTSDWTTTKAGTMTFNWRSLKSESLGALPKVTQNMAAPKLIWTILSPIAFYLITMTLLIQCWMSAMTKVIPWFSERVEESPTMHLWRRFVC